MAVTLNASTFDNAFAAAEAILDGLLVSGDFPATRMVVLAELANFVKVAVGGTPEIRFVNSTRAYVGLDHSSDLGQVISWLGYYGCLVIGQHRGETIYSLSRDGIDIASSQKERAALKKYLATRTEKITLHLS